MTNSLGVSYTAEIAVLDREIGLRVKEARSELEIRIIDIVIASYKYLGFRQKKTAGIYISIVENGKSLRPVHRQTPQLNHLGRLSRLLYLILPDDDPLILKIKETHPDFEYPPPLQAFSQLEIQQQGISGQQALSLEERLAGLTQRQQALIEKLVAIMGAQNYALRNNHKPNGSPEQ